MIDKIIIKNDSEAQIIYTNRTPVTLRADTGNICSFVSWFLSNSPLTLETYTVAEKSQQGDTCPCIILEAA